jgi:hypothetical protein
LTILPGTIFQPARNYLPTDFVKPSIQLSPDIGICFHLRLLPRASIARSLLFLRLTEFLFVGNPDNLFVLTLVHDESFGLWIADTRTGVDRCKRRSRQKGEESLPTAKYEMLEIVIW